MARPWLPPIPAAIVGAAGIFGALPAQAEEINQLARKIADEHARDFHCGKDETIVLGKTDPDLAMPKGD